MKSVVLNINDRFTLLTVLNEQQGSALDMFKVFKTIEKVRLTEEELKKINAEDTDQGLRYKADSDFEISIELEEDVFNFVKGCLEKFPYFKPDPRVFELLKKFDVVLD